MRVRKVRSLARRDRPITEVEYPMVKEPKPSLRASGLFKSKLFRFVVLLSVIFSSLPHFTLALASPPTPLAINTEEAQFIIGPQAAVSSSWFDTTEVQRARTHGEL